MTQLRLTLALTLGLAVAGFAALAQETAAPTEAPAADAAADLAMGQPAQDPNAIGATYSKAVFDAWDLRCVRTETGQDPCQLYQLLKDGQGTSVAEFNLFDLPEGGEAAAGATVIAPLETQLTAGLRIAIDGAEPKVYPFTFCARIGCVARVGFTAAEMDLLRKGEKAIVTIVPAVAPDQQVVLEASLKGFTAGFDAVKANNAALPAPEAPKQ
ncbi:MAG: invasion-associated locus B family protein [Rhodobacteraceae bacterium PARR1]|nr:MAG: invasion-associated locus B family protein [Rhodobacteraceae bacterium PARR1]